MAGLPEGRVLKFIRCFIKDEICIHFLISHSYCDTGVKRSKEEKIEKKMNRKKTKKKGEKWQILENNVNKLFVKYFK